MGKGDWRRPTQVSKQEERDRWEAAFGSDPRLPIMSEEDRLEMEAEKARLVREIEGDST